MEQKSNTFVRVLIVLLCIIFLGLIVTSFMLAEIKYQISSGILSLIVIVVILALSESFNNLSIGKVLSLSRDVKNKSKQNEQVVTENKELRNELFKIVSNVQQSQVNNTFNAPPEAWSKLLGVVKAEDDVDEEDDDSVESNELSTENVASSTEIEQQRLVNRQKSKLRRYATDAALQKYVSTLSLSDTRFVERVEFTSAFHAVDPIMDRRLVFDGYINSFDSEVFIEIRHNNMVTMMYFDRLYIMLSKVNFYRQAKKSNANLVLIIVNTPFQVIENRRELTHKLNQYFKPAIESGLLNIIEMDITEDEAMAQLNDRQMSLL